MTDRTLLTRAQVALRLGMSVEVFYREQRTLFADGFPRPVLGAMRAARWDPVAIDRWLDRKLAPLDPVQGTPADRQPDLDRYADLLDRNADQLTH